MVATAERNGHTRIPKPPQPSRPGPQPGRTGNGRFASGNPGGPGNAFARLSAKQRYLLSDSITDQDVLDLGKTLLVHAKQGNMTAARLLLQYTIGKPGEAKDPDRLDQDEWELLKDRQKHSIKEMNDALEGFPLGVILGLTKALTQILEDTLTDKFVALGQKPDAPNTSSPVPPRPSAPPSTPSQAPHADPMRGEKGPKRTPETRPDQPPGEGVNSPIEPEEVGDVGTTCPSSEDPNYDPDSDLDEGEFPGGLTEEEVLAELGMPPIVDESKRFRRILTSLHAVHALPVPGVDANETPSPEEGGQDCGADQPLAECVNSPIEPGEVGDVGTTCPSSQEPDSQGNSTLDEGKMEEDMDPEDLFSAFGIPAQVLEDARFQNLLVDIQSLYTRLTEEGSPKSESPPKGPTA